MLGPAIARPGSIEMRGHGDAVGPALALDDLGHAGREVLRRQRVVLGRVGDAEAAAEVELGQLDAELARESAVQAEHPPGGHLEPGRVEDLRPDVAVQPEQLQGVRARRGSVATASNACPPASEKPELLVLVGRRDELVRVRLDADGDADEHRRDDAELGGDGGDALDLVEGVDDDAARRRTRRAARISATLLLLPCRPMPIARDAGADGDGELAARAHVEVQALVADPPGDLGAEEGLAGVEDVGPAAQVVEHLGIRLLELARARTEVVLVET